MLQAAAIVGATNRIVFLVSLALVVYSLFIHIELAMGIGGGNGAGVSSWAGNRRNRAITLKTPGSTAWAGGRGQMLKAIPITGALPQNFTQTRMFRN